MKKRKIGKPRGYGFGLEAESMAWDGDVCGSVAFAGGWLCLMENHLRLISFHI